MALLSLSWYKFSSPAARSTTYARSALSGRWAVQQPRCKRASRVCLHRARLSRPTAPSSSASRRQVAALGPSHARLRHCCHCCSRRRCSRRHVQCLPVVRMLLHCALLRRCASPVHGPCLALLRVAVLCVVLDRRLRGQCAVLPLQSGLRPSRDPPLAGCRYTREPAAAAAPIIIAASICAQ